MPDPVVATLTVAAWPGLEPATLLGDGAVLGRARRTASDHVTFDAPDHRLARAGVVVSRDGGLWSVECRGYGTRTFEGVGDEPPAELLAALAGVGRGAPLALAARMRRRGRETPVLAGVEADREAPGANSDGPPGSATVGRLVDEDVSVLDGRRVLWRQRHVTVEGRPELVASVRRRVNALGMDERVVDAASAAPLVGPPDPPLWSLEAQPAAGAVVQRALARSVARLLAHDPVVRLDLHVEGVHQMRVAVRRLRSDVRTFAGVLRPLPDGLVDDLQWLSAELGAVRDLDVLGSSFAGAVDRLDPGDRRRSTALVRRLRRQRDVALSTLQAAMATDRYARLLDGVVELAAHPPLGDAASGGALPVLLPPTRRAWRRLRRAARAARGDDAAQDRVHALRLRAKRFRYAVDALAEIDADAAAHAAALADLQHELGELNDAVVAERWLRDQVAREHDPRRAFVLGELVMAERARQEAHRRAWPATWKRVRRRRRRAWLDG